MGIIDIDKFSGNLILVYSLVIFALIIPGMGYVYIHENDAFNNLELVKLILLSVFYSLPLFLSCLLISSNGHSAFEEGKSHGMLYLWKTSIYVFSAFFTLLGAYYLLSHFFSLDAIIFFQYLPLGFFVIILGMWVFATRK